MLRLVGRSAFKLAENAPAKDAASHRTVKESPSGCECSTIRSCGRSRCGSQRGKRPQLHLRFRPNGAVLEIGFTLISEALKGRHSVNLAALGTRPQ